MGILESSEILGCRLGEEIVCPECYEEEDGELTQDKLILKSEVEKDDKQYFCDRCGMKIGG